jgi:betaine reductase
MAIAAGLVTSRLHRNIAVVGGCSLAKLGMKMDGHMKSDMPILEDVLAGFATLICANDGVSPVLRTDSIGRHNIGAGSSQQQIMEKLATEPLGRIGWKLAQVDKYATELHNPEVTEPSGSGNVPQTNYRLIAALAALRGEIARGDIAAFAEAHGMPGYAPTQGHIASAIPFLAHAQDKMARGELKSAMFLAKGSLFLGRLTRLADGVSFLMQKNEG